MRIKYARMKNFVGIFNGMGLKEIEFTLKKKFNMYMLVGENGSGKTTIMSALNPLSVNKIREGKTGELELHIIDGNIRYKLRQIYTPQNNKSHKLSGYITRIDEDGNEIELNPNGNITSYRTVVGTELGLTDEYLNMIKMGASFKSFIDKTMAERCKTIFTFLDEAEIYLKFHKKVSDDFKTLNAIMKNITTKIDRIGDIDKIYDSLNNIEENIERYKNDNEILLNRKYELSNKIISMNLSDIEELLSELKTFDKLNNKFMKKYTDIWGFINIGVDIEILTPDSLVSRLNDMLVSNMEKIAEKQKVLNDVTSNIKNIEIMKDTYESNIDKIHDKIELEEYGNLVHKLSRYDSERDDIYQSFGKNIKNIKFDKANIYESVAESKYIDEARNRIHASYNSGVIDTLINDTGDIDYKAEICTLEKAVKKFQDEQKMLVQRLEFQKNLNNLPATLENIFNNKCSETSCPVIKHLQKLMVNVDEVSNRIDELEFFIYENNHTISIYEDVIELQSEINKLEKLTVKKMDKLKHLPVDKLSVDIIINSILKDKMLYDDCDLVYKLAMVDAKDRLDFIDEAYISLKKEIDEMDEAKRIIKENQELIDECNEQIEKLDSLQDKILESIDRMNETSKNIENYKEFVNSTGFIELYNDHLEYNRYLKKVEENNSKIEEYNNLNKKLNDINIAIENIKSMIDDNTKQRDKLLFNYKEIKKAKKEKELIENKLDDIRMVRTSLSSNKGIPLKYIKLYLEQARLLSNELLMKSFDGKYLFDSFIIDEKEFKIPFIKNNEIIEDISKGSQGEQAILSLVLVYAFVKQIGSPYNIMYLDEMDGALDKNNRKLFVSVIEKIFDMEQVFIISHNDSFLAENVGLILLKNHMMDYVNEKNIVYKF